MKKTLNPMYIRKFMAGLLLLAGALLIAPVQAEDIYKWVNEHNETQYTQMPPPHGIKAIRIQTAAPPSSADHDATPAPQQTAAESVADEAPASDEEDAGDSSDRDAEIARAMKENCDKARKNLASLNRGQIRFINPDGEVFRLTEEERQQRIEEAKSQIKLLCKS